MTTQRCNGCTRHFGYEQDFQFLLRVEDSLNEITNELSIDYNKRLRTSTDPIIDLLPKIMTLERSEFESEGIDKFFFEHPVHLCHRCFIELFLIDDYISVCQIRISLGYENSALKSIGKILSKWCPDIHFNLVEV